MLTKHPILHTIAVISFILIQTSLQQTLPRAMVTELASREARYHHYLWHNIRDNWNRLSSSTQRQIRDLSWAPPRPARRFENGNSIAISNNNAGEDFLYMHRQMIRRMRARYGTLTGWNSIPAPGDRTYPVPAAYTEPGNSGRTSTIRRWKSTDFYNSNIRPTERTLTDPAQLRRMTLGEYGTRLEMTIHGWMHLRFSRSSSYGYRPSTSNALPNIDKRWDDSRYDWLVDTYSSHVNPLFWKLHIWVDNKIDDWRRANGLSSIRWRGTWEGGPMSRVSHLWNRKHSGTTSLRGSKNEQEMEGMEVMEDTMAEVAKIFAKEGVETNFADPVVLDVDVKKPKWKLCKSKIGRKSRR